MSGETFENLLAPNLPLIRRFVQSRTRIPDRAEDIVQQTLLHAFVHRNQLRAHAKFLSWISAIAMNEIRGVARRARPDVSIDALRALVSTDRSACPHHTYERVERREWLSRGLAQLNGRDRAAIELMVREVNVDEAAKILSVSRPAMKSVYFRARRRLRHALLEGLRAVQPAGYQRGRCRD